MLKMRNYFLSLTLLCSAGINAATLFVESLDDALGTAATLRQVIMDANSGDTIQFNVAGTILLDEILGELVVDKQLTIDGQNKIVIDGSGLINVGFHIANTGTADASNTLITNIIIQNFNGHQVDPGSGTEPQELPAYGILIDSGAANCSVTNTTIKNINSGIDEVAAGIGSFVATGNLLDNTIEIISSEDNAAGDTGLVSGIFAANAVTTENCSNNTIHDLTSGNADGNSGRISGVEVDILSGDTSNNSIYNLSSGAANNASGHIIGIFASTINGNCSNNIIYNLTSNNAGNDSGDVFGINCSNTLSGNCSNNTINQLFSGAVDNNSGDVFGINILNGNIQGNCNNNTVLNLSSGDANNQPGSSLGITCLGINGDISDNTIKFLKTGGDGQTTIGAIGLSIGILNGNILNNLISDISALDSINAPIGGSGGIFATFVADGVLIACNSIFRIDGEQSRSAFGIDIRNGNNIVIRNNTIDIVTRNDGAAHGITLGDSGNEGKTITNSLLSFNTISNITGSGSNGFGITILGPEDQSIGNDLLNNSIFDINGKAINVVDNGVPVDAVITLQSAVCGANKVFIRGTLEPEVDFEESEFLVQFFASNNNTPPQTMTFIGETTIQADDTTPFMTEIKTCNIDTSGFITATATALPEGSTENNNTSEVSNTVTGCDSSTVCSLFCTPVPTPPACPLLRQGFGGQTIS